MLKLLQFLWRFRCTVAGIHQEKFIPVKSLIPYRAEMNFLAGTRTREMRPRGSNVDEAELRTYCLMNFTSGGSMSSLGFLFMPNRPA